MDEQEFDEFYEGSLRRVTAQVYAMIGSWDEAQECTQEAFVKAWSHRRRLDRAEAPEAWVRTTAYRLAVSRWRRVRRNDRFADRAVGPATTSTGPDPDHVALVAALAQLPEAQRRAIVLHHIADLPVREVARETGVAEGTVKARLSRGRTALAALLTPDDGSGPTMRGGVTHA